MDYSAVEVFAELVPLLLIGIPFAIGNGYLASRLGRNAFVWVVLSLVPLVNYFFFLYVGYQVVFHLIDRLGELTKKPAA
jgi:hypothetical protein